MDYSCNASQTVSPDEAFMSLEFDYKQGTKLYIRIDIECFKFMAIVHD